MRFFQLIIALISILFFGSCLNTKKVLENTSFETKLKESSDVAGVYKNLSVDSSSYLWSSFSDKKQNFYSRNGDIDNYSVSLLRLSDDSFQAKLFTQNNELIDSVNLRFQMVREHLSLKRKLTLIPIPFLYYIHLENKTLITIFEDQLIIKKGEIRFGWILVFLHGGNEFFLEKKYKRLS